MLTEKLRITLEGSRDQPQGPLPGVSAGVWAGQGLDPATFCSPV